MSVKKSRWTTNEEKYLVDQVRQRTTSLQTVFITVAKSLNRSEKAVQLRWYKIKDIPGNECFATFADNLYNINSTRIEIGNRLAVKAKQKTLFYKFLKFLGLR